MAQVLLHATAPAGPRNRGTVAVRIILAIPHLILAHLWYYAVEFVTVIQWVIQLFTGKRHPALFTFSMKWLAYATSVWTYVGLLYDEPYPAFIEPAADCPVQVELAYGEQVNRLTAGLRFLWIIPALFVGLFVTLGAVFVVIGAWCSIVFTGKLSDGMSTYLLRTARFVAQVYAYGGLLTDDYPSWASTAA